MAAPQYHPPKSDWLASVLKATGTRWAESQDNKGVFALRGPRTSAAEIQTNIDGVLRHYTTLNVKGA